MTSIFLVIPLTFSNDIDHKPCILACAHYYLNEPNALTTASTVSQPLRLYDPNGVIKNDNRAELVITGRTKSLFIFCWVSCLSSLDIQAGNDGIRIRDWIAERLSFAVSNGLAVFRVAMTGRSNVVVVSDFGVWTDVWYDTSTQVLYKNRRDIEGKQCYQRFKGRKRKWKEGGWSVLISLCLLFLCMHGMDVRMDRMGRTWLRNK